MNAFLRVMARVFLGRVLIALSKISDDDVLELAQKINKKVDVPVLSEEAELDIIRNALMTFVTVARELIPLIKV